jgi:hypothetical protein
LTAATGTAGDAVVAATAAVGAGCLICLERCWAKSPSKDRAVLLETACHSV